MCIGWVKDLHPSVRSEWYREWEKIRVFGTLHSGQTLDDNHVLNACLTFRDSLTSGVCLLDPRLHALILHAILWFPALFLWRFHASLPLLILTDSLREPFHFIYLPILLDPALGLTRDLLNLFQPRFVIKSKKQGGFCTASCWDFFCLFVARLLLAPSWSWLLFPKASSWILFFVCGLLHSCQKKGRTPMSWGWPILFWKSSHPVVGCSQVIQWFNDYSFPEVNTLPWYSWAIDSVINLFCVETCQTAMLHGNSPLFWHSAWGYAVTEHFLAARMKPLCLARWSPWYDAKHFFFLPYSWRDCISYQTEM